MPLRPECVFHPPRCLHQNLSAMAQFFFFFFSFRNANSAASFCNLRLVTLFISLIIASPLYNKKCHKLLQIWAIYGHLNRKAIRRKGLNRGLIE